MSTNVNMQDEHPLPNKNWFHPSYSHKVMRKWQREATLLKSHLLYPIFVTDEPNARQHIDSLPNQYRWGVNRLTELLDPLVKKGLQSVLIFGVFTSTKKNNLSSQKDLLGSPALSDESPVVLAVKLIKKKYPNILVACDVCLCAYTIHGHCGILNKDGYIDNKKSIVQISNLALHYAKAGCDIVAPSDMMDGRTKAIKSLLFKHNLNGKVAVMSYSTKYCSSFYGPFRDACHSAPSGDSKETYKNSMSDRSMYQLPISTRGLGIRCSLRCKQEGADFLMVKPGLPYLDMIRDIKNNVKNIPIAVYQVSGEYAMLCHAANKNSFDLKEAVLETCIAFRRAGASIIITYFTPMLLDWLDENRSKL